MSPSPFCTRILIVVSILVLAPLSIRAQVPDPAVVASAPVPGAGHHYIGVGTETVNPADGLLTFHLPIQTPAGRQLSFPFGFRYTGSEQFYITNNHNFNPGAALYWQARPATNFEVGGWSYDLPILTASARIYQHWTIPQPPPPTDHQCDVSQSYVFRGLDGAQYTLNLGAEWNDPAYHDHPEYCANAFAGTTPGLSLFHGISASAPTTWSQWPTQPPVTVLDRSGTNYQFPSGPTLGTFVVGVDGPAWGMPAQSITDRNGNQINLNGNAYQDTLGRNVVSWTGIGNNGDAVSISGLASSIVLHWASVPVTFPETAHTVANNNAGCSNGVTPASSINVVNEIDIPGTPAQKYTFTYEPTYGRVSKIAFPGGGYVRYVWGLNTSSAAAYFVVSIPSRGGNDFWCDVQYDVPAVMDRYVSYDGTTEVLHQHFAYSTTWNVTTPYVWDSKSTTVTSTDLLTGQATATIYSYAPVATDPGGPFDPGLANNVFSKAPVEKSVVYQDGSGHTLKTVNKTWLNAFDLVGEQTVLDNGQGITSLHCYDTSSSVVDDEVTNTYEFGFQSEGAKPSDPACASSSGLNTSAIGPLRRQTATVYNHALGNILNEPSSTTVYDGSGNIVKQTTLTYDGASVQGSGAATGLVAVSNPRGNATSVSRLLNPGNSLLTSTYVYYDTGQVYTSVDPCGNISCADMTGTNHTTTYSYADSYASGTGTPPGQTNAYLTQVTHPNTGVAHIEKFTWGYNDGLLRSQIDQNNLTTTYAYADPLLRLTQINTPDNGQTTISYNDTPPSPSVTTTKKINSTQSLTTVSVMDGLGHAKQSQLTSDPQGTVYTETTYDGFGRVWKQSNPHRTASSPTDGTTTNYFDALGRSCLVVPPDGTLPSSYSCATQPANTVLTAYSGNTTQVTDQTGRSRISKTEGLGRLAEVDEPGNGQQDAITPFAPGTGTVTISGSEQSTVITVVCGPNGQMCQHTIYDSGSVSVVVNGQTKSAGYSGPTDTPSTIATNLAAQLTAGSYVNATANANVITLTAKTSGASTNYSLSTSSTTTLPQYFSQPSFFATPSGPTLTGGTGQSASNGSGPLTLSTPAVTTYAYDTLNDLLSVSQSGRPRTFTYDSLSRLLTSTNPEVGTITYTYDANSNVSTKKDARNITTTYGYDVLNRPLSNSYSNLDPTISITYDQSNCLSLTQCQNIGHRTSMTDAAGSEIWAYDVPDRMHREQRTTSTITKTTTYTFDLAANLTSIVYPTGSRTVNYTIDSANRPSIAQDSSNGITYTNGTCANGVNSSGVCYAPPGELGSASIGVTSTFTGLGLVNSYNNRLQPAELKASSTGGNAFDITYTFVDPVTGHNAGHVNAITNNLNTNRSQIFSYDPLNRILSAGTNIKTGSACWGYQFTYDIWANLTSQAGDPTYTGCSESVMSPVTADTHNHVSAFGYDASGNATGDGVNTYAWDGESQLKSAGGVNYLYDGDGRRVSKSNGKLYWYGSGGEILAETDAAGNTTNEYIFFGGKRVALLPAGSTAQFYASDFLGSSRIVTTNTGVVCYDGDFYPYGGERTVTNSCTQNNYKFEGKERDTETGNDDFGARYYSWRFGRWLSADWSAVPSPVPYANLINPQTLNLYAMVHDDPETFADLDGHCWRWLWGENCDKNPPAATNQPAREPTTSSYSAQGFVKNSDGQWVSQIRNVTSTTTYNSDGSHTTTQTTTTAQFSAEKATEGQFLGATQTTLVMKVGQEVSSGTPSTLLQNDTKSIGYGQARKAIGGEIMDFAQKLGIRDEMRHFPHQVAQDISHHPLGTAGVIIRSAGIAVIEVCPWCGRAMAAAGEALAIADSAKDYTPYP